MPKYQRVFKLLFVWLFNLCWHFNLLQAFELQEPLWRFITGGRIRSYPAVAKNGWCYFISDDRFLYVVDSQGEQRWRCYLGERLADCLALGFDGTAYVGHKNGTLKAINKMGKIIWRLELDQGLSFAPAIGPDGRVYLVSDEGNLLVISHHGSLLTSVAIGGRPQIAPVLDADRSLIIIRSDGVVLRYSREGKRLWGLGLGGRLSAPAIGATGDIYLGSSNGKFYCINTKGLLRWELNLQAASLTPSLDETGVIYVPLQNKMLYALEPSGRLLWSLTLGEIPAGSCAVGADGKIYLATLSSNLIAIDKKGFIIWTTPVKGHLTSLVLSPDALLYAGSSDWSIYAFKASQPTRSVWPLEQADSLHTGFAQRPYQLPSIDELYQNNPEFNYFKALLRSGNTDLLAKALEEIKEIKDELHLAQIRPFLIYLLYPIAGYTVVEDDKTIHYPFRGYSPIRHDACLIYTRLAGLEARGLLLKILAHDPDWAMKAVAVSCLRYLASDPEEEAQRLLSSFLISTSVAGQYPSFVREAILCLQAFWEYHGTFSREAISALFAIIQGPHPQAIRALARDTLLQMGKSD